MPLSERLDPTVPKAQTRAFLFQESPNTLSFLQLPQDRVLLCDGKCLVQQYLAQTYIPLSQGQKIIPAV